jgi:hypothetical protein
MLEHNCLVVVSLQAVAGKELSKLLALQGASEREVKLPKAQAEEVPQVFLKLLLVFHTVSQDLLSLLASKPNKTHAACLADVLEVEPNIPDAGRCVLRDALCGFVENAQDLALCVDPGHAC